MTTTSSVAMRAVYALLPYPSKVFLGDRGDESHMLERSGYHLSRQDVRPGDYSTGLPLDQGGSDIIASALDTGLSPQDNLLMTTTLIWGIQHGDLRLRGVREVAGITAIGPNGDLTVRYFDAYSGQYGSTDRSHEGHNHMGFYRSFNADVSTCEDVARYLIEQYSELEGDDMPLNGEDLAAINGVVINVLRSVEFKAIVQAAVATTSVPVWGSPDPDAAQPLGRAVAKAAGPEDTP